MRILNESKSTFPSVSIHLSVLIKKNEQCKDSIQKPDMKDHLESSNRLDWAIFRNLHMLCQQIHFYNEMHLRLTNQIRSGAKRWSGVSVYLSWHKTRDRCERSLLPAPSGGPSCHRAPHQHPERSCRLQNRSGGPSYAPEAPPSTPLCRSAHWLTSSSGWFLLPERNADYKRVSFG